MGEADAGHLQVRLVLEPEPEARPAEVERLARQLYHEVRQLDVEDVQPVRDARLPDGAKAGAAALVGEWLITLSAGGGVLVTVIAGLKDWLARRSGAHQLKLTIGGDSIELSAATAEERVELVEAFLARHRG